VWLTTFGKKKSKIPLAEATFKTYSVHMNDIRFEWDEAKSRQNRRKHGVSFEEAQTVIRIVSARKADKQEETSYWSGR